MFDNDCFPLFYLNQPLNKLSPFHPLLPTYADLYFVYILFLSSYMITFPTRALSDIRSYVMSIFVPNLTSTALVTKQIFSKHLVNDSIHEMLTEKG